MARRTETVLEAAGRLGYRITRWADAYAEDVEEAFSVHDVIVPVGAMRQTGDEYFIAVAGTAHLVRRVLSADDLYDYPTVEAMMPLHVRRRPYKWSCRHKREPHDVICPVCAVFYRRVDT